MPPHRLTPLSLEAVSVAKPIVPRLIEALGPAAVRSYINFYTAELDNPYTAHAYKRDAELFLAWCDRKGLVSLTNLDAWIVKAWVQHRRSADGAAHATIRRNLAAISRLLGHLVQDRCLPFNAAADVKRPKVKADTGSTPGISTTELTQLLSTIPRGTPVGERDRLFLYFLFHTLARVGAAVRLTAKDIFIDGNETCIHLHEKGGRHHIIPCHEALEPALSRYFDYAGIHRGSSAPVFQKIRTGQRGRHANLSGVALDRNTAWRRVKFWLQKASLNPAISPHSFRVGGAGAMERAGVSEVQIQRTAGHRDPKTTQLYLRGQRRPSREAINKIAVPDFVF